MKAIVLCNALLHPTHLSITKHHKKRITGIITGPEASCKESLIKQTMMSSSEEWTRLFAETAAPPPGAGTFGGQHPNMLPKPTRTQAFASGNSVSPIGINTAVSFPGGSSPALVNAVAAGHAAPATFQVSPPQSWQDNPSQVGAQNQDSWWQTGGRDPWHQAQPWENYAQVSTRSAA